MNAGSQLAVRRLLPLVAVAAVIAAIVSLAVHSPDPPPAPTYDAHEPYDPLNPPQSSPEFSLPPVSGCQHPDGDALPRATASLAPATGITGAQQVSGPSNSTIIAADLTSGGRPTGDEPVVWVWMHRDLYAVGAATLAVSTATDSLAVNISVADEAVVHAVSCVISFRR